MEIPIYQIDAFSSKVFSGNPAAVCPLMQWLDDSVLQAIAQENNLSETAFFVPETSSYLVRWFTPTSEVDLCGHATLAAAFVIFHYIDTTSSEVIFRSKSGTLRVFQDGKRLSMDFPSQPPAPCAANQDLVDGLGKRPMELLRSEDYLAVFGRDKDIFELDPDMRVLKKLDLRGVIVTARGQDMDFVSRFFAPKYGVDEDPVTGSAHCALTPYWSKKLGKKRLRARQVSQRGGELYCTDCGERVVISGHAVKFMEGTVTI